MTKTVSLNDMTYSELAVFAGRLSMIAKKPISLGMAITFGILVSEALLDQPGVQQYFEKRFSEYDGWLTPEEFDSVWDKFYKVITGEKKK